MTPKAEKRAALAALVAQAVELHDGARKFWPKPPAVKSVAGYAGDYYVTLTEIVTGTLNGLQDATDQARQHRQLIRDYAESTYVEGMVESGQFKDAREARANLEDDDERRIEQWIKDQTAHVKDYANATAQAADDIDKQGAILERAKLWQNAVAEIGNFGRASGQANVMVTWKYGDTDHCDTCQELNGKRHRLKWFTTRGYIPRQVASETLDCGGWNCQCKLENDAGELVL